MEIISISTEHGGILLLTFTGEVKNIVEANALKSDVDMVAKKIKNFNLEQGKCIKILVDITGFKADYITEGVNALIDLAREDTSLVEKTAVFGASSNVRVIGQTIVALSGRTNIEFFENKMQALEWLNKA